ncbi:MAG: Fic family protein [Nanoarchaeota archaeon]|nr:Fic family protein [Nanoarchaeota archaeon]
MVYIYKKTINGKPYYYLRISKIVKGKTVVKDIAYLGSEASEVEQKLNKLSGYKDAIRKAYRNIKKFIQSEHYLKKAEALKLKSNPYISQGLLEEVEAAKLHFNEHFQKLNEKTREETYKNFLIDFAFNTTSIEGNTITLNEASRLLKENLTPKNRTLREIHDLKNTEKVFFQILDLKEKISHESVIRMHDQLLENIDARKGYRAHDVRVLGSRFEPSPAVYIKTDMDILFKWLDKNEEKLHPLALAGLFHQKFERIHPFADGNGRTGRMLVNYMLLRKGYPPIIVRKSRRADYLNALAQGNKLDLNETRPEYFKDLTEYLAEEMVHGYWNSFLT